MGGGNNNGFEIDDGSRNITISNSTAFKCLSGIEVKAHDYAPPPYNVTIDTVRIINCPSVLKFIIPTGKDLFQVIVVMPLTN